MTNKRIARFARSSALRHILKYTVHRFLYTHENAVLLRALPRKRRLI
jgi:hypothetical protein